MSERSAIVNVANETPRIFLSAGEASGDHYGAALIQELQKTYPRAHFVGLGGAQMRSAGQQQTVRAEEVAVMGITEILRHIPAILGHYRRLVKALRAHRPDVAVLIDFPDVNFRLAKHLHRAGVPVIWFVSPQLWAWKRSRLRWVQQRVDRMLVIFPFEEPFYRARDVDATFVGHPLAELPPPAITREDFALQYDLDPAKTWIALLPGSRWKELRANLPALYELAANDLIHAQAAATTFDGDRFDQPQRPATHFEFLLPVASTIDRTRLGGLLEELRRDHLRYMGTPARELRLTLVDDAREALQHARASVVASGTATVQAAVVGNPFVVVYRVSPLTFALAKKLIAYPAEWPPMRDRDGNLPIAMVNLLAGRRIVPELVQSKFTASNVAAALAPLLDDSPQREAQISALADVHRALLPPGGYGSIQRVASAVQVALQQSLPDARKL
jgi:lipid-A-disaccharide synthase